MIFKFPPLWIFGRNVIRSSMLTISFSQQKFRTPLLVSHQGEKLPMTMTFDVIKIRGYLIGKQSNESTRIYPLLSDKPLRQGWMELLTWTWMYCTSIKAINFLRIFKQTWTIVTQDRHSHGPRRARIHFISCPCLCISRRRARQVKPSKLHLTWSWYQE